MNGDFEAWGDDSSDVHAYVNSQDVDGWAETSGDQIQLFQGALSNFGPANPQTNTAVELATFKANTIAQNIDVSDLMAQGDRELHFSFDHVMRQGYDSDFDAIITDQDGNDLFRQSFPNTDSSNWTTYSTKISLNANTTSVRVLFDDTSADNEGGAVLDNIKLSRLNTDSETYQASHGASLNDVVEGMNNQLISDYDSPNVSGVQLSVTDDYRLQAFMAYDKTTKGGEDSYSDLRVAGNLATLMGDYDQQGLVMTAEETTVQDIDISTRTGAQNAIAAIDSAFKQLDEQRADIAAMENRIGHSLNSLEMNKLNIAGANSKILDTQIGKETVSMTKMAMLQNATMSMLGQAKNIPWNSLQLLK
ncbi:flagellin [Veronia nyctiphanis]|uniref:flagellin n=1 Tax=Veronia nyctiphanis TaxID=1278244 RepID=UPI00100B7E9A|nr:flagellin [Veronia nyctiphanis]